MPPCEARRKSGGPCKNYAVRGANVCRMHGGGAPQVRRAAKLRAAASRVMPDGPAHIDPADALEDALARLAAGVEAAAANGSRREQLDWLLAQVKAAETMLRAGIAEHRQRIAEDQVRQLLEAIDAYRAAAGVDDFHHTQGKRALAAVLRGEARGAP